MHRRRGGDGGHDDDMPVDTAALNRLARRQGGALARSQVLAAGGTSSWLRGRVRQRQWQRPHPGVYVVFTGPLPWRARTWAGVLYAGAGAVLGYEAAGHDAGLLARAPGTVDVLVPASRMVRPQPGLRMHSRTHLVRDQLLATPPRTRLEPTVLDLVSRCADVDAVVATVTAGVRRGASPEGLLEMLADQVRHRWRRALLDVLADADLGVESTLEWHFHHGVERRHGPSPGRAPVAPQGGRPVDPRRPQVPAVSAAGRAGW